MFPYIIQRILSNDRGLGTREERCPLLHTPNFNQSERVLLTFFRTLVLYSTILLRLLQVAVVVPPRGLYCTSTYSAFHLSRNVLCPDTYPPTLQAPMSTNNPEQRPLSRGYKPTSTLTLPYRPVRRVAASRRILRIIELTGLEAESGVNERADFSTAGEGGSRYTPPFPPIRSHPNAISEWEVL